jgi:UDP-N-acetylglucosamine:LPS N-acetylglucosamine transferase
MKICLICSVGGHLNQLVGLKDIYSRYSYFFVTFYSKPLEEFSKKERVYFITDTKRNLFLIIKNLFQSFKIYLKEKPDIVITTGAGVAIPMCYVSKIFGCKIIFIEDFCKVRKPSISGRLVYPIADLFIIQWRYLKRFYKKAIYGRQIF